jgi:hypothetical protein
MGIMSYKSFVLPNIPGVGEFLLESRSQLLPYPQRAVRVAMERTIALAVVPLH